MSEDKKIPLSAALQHLAEQEKISLTAALRHLAEQESRTPSEHATPGELTAYHEGTLPPPIEARVREHLAHCKLCSDLLLDLAGFADLAPPPGVPELTDAEVEEDWQALRRKLGVGEGDKPLVEEKPKASAEVVPIRRPVVPRKPDREFSIWQVIAAALLVAAVGLSAWVMSLKREVAFLVAQRVGGTMVVFDDGEQVRGEGEDKRPIMLTSQPATFVFYSEDSYPNYFGDIVSDGKVVIELQSKFDAPSFQPKADVRRISFWVGAGILEPGQYEARLFGAGPKERELIGSLKFEVNAP